MKRKKRALVTGVTGQDGSYLAEYLIGLGYEVWGLLRRTSLDPTARLTTIIRSPRFHLVHGNMRDAASLRRALRTSRPDEVYNLAAQSDVGISFLCPEETFEVNYEGVGKLMNEIRREVPHARVYQASTSEMYGATPPLQNELSPFVPVSPYGEAKLKAHKKFVMEYRERYGLFIASGILFNHESPRRGQHFVTRKSTLSLARIQLGLQKDFTLGNLEARRDWGFAGDYVKAMHLMLQKKTPRDYVIATGVSHTVRELVAEVGSAIGMPITWHGSGLKEVGKDPKGNTVVRVDRKFYRPVEVHNLCGDPARAREELGWRPTVSFEKLIRMMAKADLAQERERIGRNFKALDANRRV